MKKPKSDYMALLTPGLEDMWRAKVSEYSSGMQALLSNSSGDALNYTATSTATQAISAMQQQTTAYPWYRMTPNYNPPRHKVCFMRVNDKVEMDEGAVLQDALDGLRLKVKRWLKIPETEFV